MFNLENSIFVESSYFVSDVETSGAESVILLGFKIHPNESSDYFLTNWREVSELGNLLIFLYPKFCVKKIMFLHNVRDIPKEENMFQFVVMVEIIHKNDDLIYLLDFVQRARSLGHIGFLSLYKTFIL